MKFTITDSALRDPLTYHVEITENPLCPGHVQFEFYFDGYGYNTSFSGYFNPEELIELFKQCIIMIRMQFEVKKEK